MPDQKSSSARWEKTRALYEREEAFYDQETREEYYKEFRALLEKRGIIFDAKHTYLEVGGGEYPFLKVLDTKKCIVLDPFWDPHYDKHTFTFHKIKLEELDAKEAFDYSFILNVIDHVDDIDVAVAKLHSVMKKGGKAVFILNTYYQPSLQRFFQRFNQYVDRPHPHHFTKEQFVALMEKHGFKLADFGENFEREHFKKSGEEQTVGKRIVNILKDPFLIIRILIIRLSVLLTRKPFRPAHLYVFEA